ncbi:hypothetical protein CEXT_247271 [Caerostris extrusa]|uniref:Uncharacterized protein n=1 Tax=Caerostris extrusa TaxID=172846 RepID=A0AAV4ME67_CAEEX|nr:hypothetical protein CEXT_247271 [Caerostris extrusa]
MEFLQDVNNKTLFKGWFPERNSRPHIEHSTRKGGGEGLLCTQVHRAPRGNSIEKRLGNRIRRLMESSAWLLLLNGKCLSGSDTLWAWAI